MRTIDIDDLREERMNTDDEQLIAYRRVHDLVDEFLDDMGYMPSTVHIDDNDELQSLMMWAAHVIGLKIHKTKRESYVS